MRIIIYSIIDTYICNESSAVYYPGGDIIIVSHNSHEYLYVITLIQFHTGVDIFGKFLAMSNEIGLIDLDGFKKN